MGNHAHELTGKLRATQTPAKLEVPAFLDEAEFPPLGFVSPTKPLFQVPFVRQSRMWCHPHPQRVEALKRSPEVEEIPLPFIDAPKIENEMSAEKSPLSTRTIDPGINRRDRSSGLGMTPRGRSQRRNRHIAGTLHRRPGHP
uniref:Uncharacterized protein n=1 Tax=Ditylenchus dipsaci TaxID=166011 RepID=A0A915DTU3_9BILA